VYPYDVESGTLKCSINVVKQNFEEIFQQLQKQFLLGSLSVTGSSVACEAAEHSSQSEHGTLEERVQIFSLIEGIQIRFVYFQAEVHAAKLV